MLSCSHGYIIPSDLTSLPAKDLLLSGGLVSPYCLDCWADPRIADLLAARFYQQPNCRDACTYGYCELISQVARRRGFARDSFGRQSKESDLRLRLLEKKSVIEAAIAGKDKLFVDNYIRRTLKNSLTNDQTSSEGKVIAESTTSLSDTGGFRTDRKALSQLVASNVLADLTGGDSSTSDDDESLDKPGTLIAPEPELPEVRRRGTKHSDEKHLFDSLLAEASSQIATLTGGRKDGFETYLDLEKALSKIPDNERMVFEALYLENGELLNRPRTYPEAEFLTGLSTQNVRTLERKAIEKLRPALAPSFFKRRA